MRRDVRIILGTLLMGGLWTGGSRVAEAVSSMDTFRVTEVEISGLEEVERGEVLALMGLTPATSVWGDVAAWEERLGRHPLVKVARVQRRIPGTLVVDLVERRPVALAPTPLLEPVDGEGILLPLDPAQDRMDLPLLGLREAPAPGARLLPAKDRALAAEVARLAEMDPAFVQMVSELSWGADRSTLVARLAAPDAEIHFGPGVPAARLRQGLAALADAAARRPEAPPAVIDLRFADQVVVRGKP